MRRRLTWAVCAAMVAGVWVTSPLAQSTSAPQKPAAAPAAPAAPAKPAEPQVPADYKAVMEASKIEDPAKRTEAMQKAVADLVRRNTPPPADQKAYQDAMRTADSAKRVEALRKFVVDFPKSAFTSGVEYELVASMAADANKQILAQANKVIDATADDGKPMMMNNVADKLMAANLLLDQAEAIAKKSVAAWDEKKYIESNKKSFETMVASMIKANPNAKVPTLPTDEDLRKQFLNQKSYSQTTLGEIYMKQGRQTEAEAAFKELYTTKPSAHAVAMAAGYLADYAKAAKKSQEAFDYLLTASDNERLSAARQKDFQEAYKTTHGGSMAGFEEMLDARYEKNLPKPKVTPYVSTKDRSNRVVLAEIFTGAGCPPCVGADVAFEGALDRYKGQELAVLMYHLHIPLPDPMTNPSTETRQKFYGINGVPAFYVDGVSDGMGGGSAEAAPRIYKDRLEPMIEKLLTTKADTTLTLLADMANGVVKVKAAAGKTDPALKHVTLQIALAEERVHYAGENGVRFHPMVVRSLGGKDAAGFPIDGGKALRVEQTFDLAAITGESKTAIDAYETKRGNGFKFSERKSDIDPKNLVVVAFLQDNDTKKVLQSAILKVK